MGKIKFRIGFLSILVVFVFVLSAYEAFGSIVYDIWYTWDDETLQGWQKQLPFDGELGVSSAPYGPANPAMYATDTKSAGSPLYALAPDELYGVLTDYDGIFWDEYIPGRPNTSQSTYLILQGSDGTRYQSGRLTADIQTNHWYPRSVPLDDPLAWLLVKNSGEMSLDDVIKDENGLLFLSMDTSSSSNGTVESWVDNFGVYSVPIPGAVWLLGSGLIGIAVLRRKFRRLI